MRSMPSDRVRSGLVDIRDNIGWARDFIAGLTFEAFSGSRLHFYAVTRALEIISEASRKLPQEMLDRHPDIPWRAVRDVGNLYRHSYDNVAETYVWATVRDHLQPLLSAVLAELERLETPGAI